MGFGLISLISAATFVLSVYHRGLFISVLGTLGAYATPRDDPHRAGQSGHVVPVFDRREPRIVRSPPHGLEGSLWALSTHGHGVAVRGPRRSCSRAPAVLDDRLGGDGQRVPLHGVFQPLSEGRPGNRPPYSVGVLWVTSLVLWRSC